MYEDHFRKRYGIKVNRGQPALVYYSARRRITNTWRLHYRLSTANRKRKSGLARSSFGPRRRTGSSESLMVSTQFRYRWAIVYTSLFGLSVILGQALEMWLR